MKRDTPWLSREGYVYKDICIFEKNVIESWTHSLTVSWEGNMHLLPSSSNTNRWSSLSFSVLPGDLISLLSSLSFHPVSSHDTLYSLLLLLDKKCLNVWSHTYVCLFFPPDLSSLNHDFPSLFSSLWSLFLSLDHSENPCLTSSAWW